MIQKRNRFSTNSQKSKKIALDFQPLANPKIENMKRRLIFLKCRFILFKRHFFKFRRRLFEKIRRLFKKYRRFVARNRRQNSVKNTVIYSLLANKIAKPLLEHNYNYVK